MEGDNNDNEKGKGKANNNMGDFFGFLTNFLAPESRFTIFIIPVKANPSKLFDDKEEEEDNEEGSRGGQQGQGQGGGGGQGQQQR